MIQPRRGRNINVSKEVDHFVIPINAVSLTVLVPANEKRIGFTACLPPGVDPVDVRILYAPADTIDVGQARDVLTRNTMGNASLFRPLHEMPTDNVYTGEISAITSIGIDLLITES